MGAEPDLRIRAASETDLPGLRELEAACFDPPWSADALRRSLEREEVVAFVAAGPGGTVGYAIFVRIVDESELLRIGVDPALRRRGIARDLLVAGLERLPGACHLEVRAGARAARELYRSLGFVEVGRRRRYYPGGEDAILARRAAELPLPTLARPRLEC